jgi:mRNA interferase MazF
MPNMTTYNFGDIILVPFPFTDQSTSKKRPAVVISSDAYNNDRPDIILMAVTSQMRHLGNTGEAAVEDWQEAGLLKPSLIKPILTTIEKTLVLKKLGSLSERDRHTLQEILQTIIGKA